MRAVCVWLFLVGLPAWGQLAFGVAYPKANWYVDSVSGSDSNTGQVNAQGVPQPFKTIAHLLAQSITTGQTIAFANSSDSATCWHEDYIVPQNNLKHYTYGPGTPACFDGALPISPSDFSKTGGYTNMYQAAKPVEIDNSGGANWPSVWVNGVRLVEVADLATCDPITTGCYVAANNQATSPLTIYVNPPGNTNPIADGKLYEYAALAHGFNGFNVTGVIVSGILARRQYNSYGAITLGQTSKAYNVTGNDGNDHNILLRQGAECHTCTANGGYAYLTQSIPFIAYENTGTGGNIWWDHPTVTWSTESVAGAVGLLNHTSSGTFGTITLTSPNVTCQSGDNGAAFESVNASLLYITNATVSGCANSVKSGVNTTVRTATQTGTPGGGWFATQDAAGITYDFDSVTATINTGGGGGVQGTLANFTLILTNSTFTGAGKIVRTTQTGANITANHNNYAAYVNGNANYLLSGASPILSSDYNTFNGRGAAYGFTIGSTVYLNFTTYQSGTGQDAHSTD